VNKRGGGVAARGSCYIVYRKGGATGEQGLSHTAAGKTGNVSIVGEVFPDRKKTVLPKKQVMASRKDLKDSKEGASPRGG